MNILNNIQDIKTPTSIQEDRKNSEKPKTSAKFEYKPDILDIFSEKVVNKKDINDMVTVPRTIFKGYLCFTAGTALNSIAALIKQNKFSKGLNIAGLLMSIYGTFNFVQPFLIKEKDLTKSEK